MHWTDLPVHVIDFEGNVRTGVVECGIVTLNGGVITHVSARLCRPRAAVARADTEIHGLTDAELAAAEPFENEWPRFAALRETGVLAAHFSATENAMLRAIWPSPRLSPDFLRPGTFVAEWGPWIDTGRIAAEVLPAASGRLEDLISTLGLHAVLEEHARLWCVPSRCRFHCAGYDALACALVLQTLARDAEGKPWSLARVVTMSTSNPRLRDERRQAQLF